MKIFPKLCLLTLIVSSAVFAKTDADKTGSGGTLRDQMDKMILSVSDMDIMVNKTKEIDYGILQEDAERILDALNQIRKLDPNGEFHKHVTNLQRPAEKLLQLAKAKDPKVAEYPEQIFNACFKCHAEHRSENFLFQKKSQ